MDVTLPAPAAIQSIAWDGQRLVADADPGPLVSGPSSNPSFYDWARISGIPEVASALAADENSDGVPNGIAYLQGTTNPAMD